MKTEAASRRSSLSGSGDVKGKWWFMLAPDYAQHRLCWGDPKVGYQPPDGPEPLPGARHPTFARRYRQEWHPGGDHWVRLPAADSIATMRRRLIVALVRAAPRC